MSTKCEKPATVKQQMTHAATLQLLTGPARYSSKPFPATRHLCAEHADVIDDDWILIECVNLGDVASVLAWADKRCDHVEEDRVVCMACVFNRHEVCLGGTCLCVRCYP